MIKFFWSFIVLSTLFFTHSFAADGETLYKKCKGCHGIDGKHVPYERENGVIAGRDRVELEALINSMREGSYPESKINKIMMRIVKRFKDEDITSLAIYINSLKK